MARGQESVREKSDARNCPPMRAVSAVVAVFIEHRYELPYDATRVALGASFASVKSNFHMP
jgi:hypothetical protein